MALAPVAGIPLATDARALHEATTRSGYVFVYSDGEDLLRRWLAHMPAHDRANWFGRLLCGPLTPAAIEAEIAAAG